MVGTTWQQSIAEFPALSVGFTYLPIPVGGAITLPFVAEGPLIGRPPQAGEPLPVVMKFAVDPMHFGIIMAAAVARTVKADAIRS